MICNRCGKDIVGTNKCLYCGKSFDDFVNIGGIGERGQGIPQNEFANKQAKNEKLTNTYTYFKDTGVQSDEDGLLIEKVRLAKGKKRIPMIWGIIYLIIGYGIMNFFARIASSMAAMIGILVCILYALPLVFFKNKVHEKCELYIDSLENALKANVQSDKIIQEYEHYRATVKSRRSTLKHLGIILFLAYIIISVIIVFASNQKNNGTLEFLFNIGGILITAILCGYPYFVYNEISSLLESNDVKTAFRPYNSHK